MPKYGLVSIMLMMCTIASSRLLTKRTGSPEYLDNNQHLQTGEEKLEVVDDIAYHKNQHQMTSLLRKRRNAVAMSQELIVNKQVEVFQGLSNPDTFRVSVTGNTVFTNVTVYNLIIIEDTTGLEITSINNPSDQDLLDIQTNFMAYNIGTFTGTETLELSYDATLRNFGSEILSTQNISTLFQYQLTPLVGSGSQETLNIVVCIQKSIYIISSCSWCGAILVIVVCFFVGILLAFLLLLAYLCLFTPLPIIGPTRRDKTQEEFLGKKESSKRLDLETANLAAVLNSTENEKQMLNYVESLEIRQLVELNRTINEERLSLTKEVMQTLLLMEEKHNNLENKETIQYCLEQLTNDTNKKKTKLMANENKSNVKDEKTRERKKEIEIWNERLKDFDPQVKEELMLLVEQRHVYDKIDEEFIENLNKFLESSTIISADDLILENCLKQLEQCNSSELDDVVYKVVECERLVLRQFCCTFSENARKISEMAKNRNEVIRRTNEDLKIEKKIWEKITTQQLEIVRKAKRREIISPDEAKEVKEKVETWMKNLKVKCEGEFRKVKREISKNYQFAKERLHHKQQLRDGYIEDADDVQKLVFNRTNFLAKQFQTDLEIETELDKAAFKLYESLPSTLSRFRKLAMKEQENLREALLSHDVDPRWIDEMFENQREELRRYCDDIDDVEATSSDSLPCDVINDDNANFRLLQKIGGSQPMSSNSANLSQMKSEILLRKKGLYRLLNQKIQQTSRDYLRNIKEKVKMIGDVMEGDDVIGIRRELQEKLSYAVGDKKKTKKSHLRHKRHHAIASYRDMKIILSGQLRHHYQGINEKSTLIHERHIMEELTMTLLDLMTSSGQLTSRECKLVLDEFKSEAEEIKSKYVIERRRKEEALKRKTERKLKKKQNALMIQNLNHKNSESLVALLHVTDDVKESSSARIDDERSTVQELFSNVNDVYTDQERALLSHELMLLRKLTGAMRVDLEETKSVLELLLPGKPGNDIRNLCHMICPEERVKKKSVKTGILLEAVRRKKYTQPDEFLSYNSPMRCLVNSLIQFLVNSSYLQTIVADHWDITDVTPLKTKVYASWLSIVLGLCEGKVKKVNDRISSVSVQKHPSPNTTSSRLSARSRKLSPLSGASPHNIGTRPELFGKSSSSEKVDRYDMKNLS